MQQGKHLKAMMSGPTLRAMMDEVCDSVVLGHKFPTSQVIKWIQWLKAQKEFCHISLPSH